MALFLIIKAKHEKDSNKNCFLLASTTSKKQNERFDKKSKLGIITAGKTRRLDNEYVNLLLISQEYISE